MKIFQRKKGNYFLALDIGTETVKTLVVKEGVLGKTVILGASLKYFDQFGVFDDGIFSQEIVKKTISETIKEAQEQSLTRPNLGEEDKSSSSPFANARVGEEDKSSSSPFANARVAKVSLPADIFKVEVSFQSFFRKNFQKIIDEKEEKEILETALTKGEKEISQRFGKKIGILPEDFKFLNFKILEIKINGYKVPKLSGYKGKNLDFKILFTFLAKSYFENYQKIFRELKLEILKIYHPFEKFNLFLNMGDGVFLDIGGELTQGFLLKNGNLEKIFDFPVGAKRFSQTLSETLGILPARCRALKERYSKGELSEEVRKRVNQIFAKDINLWFQNLNDNLKFLPKKVFLFGGGSLLPEIGEILEQNEFLAKIIYPKDLTLLKDSFSTPLSLFDSPQYLPPLLIIPSV